MTSARPGLIGLLRFEARKFLARSLPWCLFGIIAAVTVVLGLIERNADEPSASYALYSHLVTRSLPLTAFLTMILGALSLNREITTGSLRALLLRPVRRREVVFAKAVMIVAFGVVASLVAICSAWAFTRFTTGFSGIAIEIPGFEAREVISAARMSGFALKLTAAAALSIISAGLFGLAISVLVESEGIAVAAAIIGFLAMQVLAPALPALADWMFPTYMERALGWLRELAVEDQSHENEVAALGLFSRAFVVPALTSLVFVVAAALAFERKDLPC